MRDGDRGAAPRAPAAPMAVAAAAYEAGTKPTAVAVAVPAGASGAPVMKLGPNGDVACGPVALVAPVPNAVVADGAVELVVRPVTIVPKGVVACGAIVLVTPVTIVPSGVVACGAIVFVTPVTIVPSGVVACGAIVFVMPVTIVPSGAVARGTIVPVTPPATEPTLPTVRSTTPRSAAAGCAPATTGTKAAVAPLTAPEVVPATRWTVETARSERRARGAAGRGDGAHDAGDRRGRLLNELVGADVVLATVSPAPAATCRTAWVTCCGAFAICCVTGAAGLATCCVTCAAGFTICWVVFVISCVAAGGLGAGGAGVWATAAVGTTADCGWVAALTVAVTPVVAELTGSSRSAWAGDAVTETRTTPTAASRVASLSREAPETTAVTYPARSRTKPRLATP